jgi:hypothetical protein
MARPNVVMAGLRPSHLCQIKSLINNYLPGCDGICRDAALSWSGWLKSRPG